jgi:hypothetical protein
MPLLDKTRRRRKRRSINLFGLRGRKRNSRAYTLKRRRGERMSHFKKATSFVGEARGPKPKQTDEPAQQEGPLSAYARSLLRQPRDDGAIENNYVQPVEFDDPGKWHTMARQDGRRGAYTQSLISQHMEETRIASRARNKGAKPP